MLEAKGLMVFYENVLALNNVSVRCGENQIVGVFGANSAGKSTLMYALSGIMEDIRKKEAMAGGERITILGEIRYLGKDIMYHEAKPSRQKRNCSLPRKAKNFQGEQCTGKSAYWRVSGKAVPGQRNHGLCFHDFPRP